MQTSSAKALIRHLLWPSVAGLFCALWLCVFTLELGSAPKGELPFHQKIVQILDLPVALFWRLFPAAGAIDVWAGKLPGPGELDGIYYQIFLSTFAYTVLFAALGLAWRLSPIGRQLGGRGERLGRVGRLVLAATTLTLAIWTLETYRMASPFYPAIWRAAHWAGLPVEVSGRLLPEDLRGGPAYPPCMSPIEPQPRLAHLRLPLHVLFGTAVYLVLYYLLQAVLRRGSEISDHRKETDRQCHPERHPGEVSGEAVQRTFNP